VAGLAIQGRISPASIDLLTLEQPYDAIVREVVAGKDQADIVLKVGFNPYNTSIMAAETVTETDTSIYLKLLETVATRVQVGSALRKLADKLMRGEEVDIARASAELSKLEANRFSWRTADTVEPEAAMWIPTHWNAWDEYFGGMPKMGLILLAGAPKGGKTHAVVKLIDRMTRKRKKVAMLSLEMTAGMIVSRWMDVRPGLTKGQRRYLRIDDGVYDADTCATAISRLVAEDPEIYCIFIDFADLMIPKGQREDTGNASYIYMTIANAAKQVQRPVVLLSQLSGDYVGGVPRVNHIRFSRLAEAMASMIVLIHNPDGIFVDTGKDDKKAKLPYIEGQSYLILGASRWGYKSGIGGIRISFNGKEGWGDNGESWHNL
jgi:replicative DNA helicase